MAGCPPPKRIRLVEGTDDEHFVRHSSRWYLVDAGQ